MGNTNADKSWRNCELVVYPEQLEKVQEILASGWVNKWAWILHDSDKKKDGTPKETHAHVMCSWGKATTKTSVICNKFEIRENQVEKIKGTWSDALDYLTHGNAPEKHQYDAAEVHANFDWQVDAEKSKFRQESKLDEIISMITTGEIREYNMTDFISGEEYVKHERKIKAALAYRLKYVKAHLQELVGMKDIVWIYGETGSGKTTFAKATAKGYKLAYTLTSVGTNPFDDYLDEPCVIMDDLRPEDLRFSDLLGILDPYNFKHAAARYHNKALQTQLVIVTTIQSPEQFARACNGDSIRLEDERQLYRRLNSVYEVTKEEIIEYTYNDVWQREIENRIPNYWLKIAQNDARKRSNGILFNMAEDAMNTLDSMGIATA